MPYRRSAAALSLALALVASSAAFAQAPTDPADNPADKAFLEAFRDGMIGMHRSMPTGDTDVDFTRLVTPQNKSVAEMAKTEVQYGKDADLKTIAQQMIDTREKEAAAIKTWQDKHPAH